MSRDLLAISEGLLEGSLSIEDHFPVSIPAASTLLEITPRVAFVESFANVIPVRDAGELGLVDAGGVLHARQVRDAVRTWADEPLAVAVYTHGHVDHCFSVPVFESEPGAPPVRVIAHEAVPARFDRYRLTHGYNGIINMRQFRTGAPMFPDQFRYPDETYRSDMELTVGSVRIELHHDRGETDDHTWAWLPEEKVLCTGDLFIWVSPNCGNPQKAQRYPAEWAAALRRMAGLGAEVLLPGHGLPIAGADRITTVLCDTAELLEVIVAQCLALMNDGARLDRLVHEVEVPAELLARPWLQPAYDDPEFIIHNVWRLYGGWYDGNPATLKAAPEAALASELAALAGGAGVLAARAAALAGDGDLRLAGHLAELASLAAPEDREVHGVRRDVFAARVRAESSLMAKGIFAWAEHESAAVAGDPGSEPEEAAT